MYPSDDPRLAELTRDPLDIAAMTRAVESPQAGAVATFVGVVRAETRGGEAPAALRALDYTAYDKMALAEMRRICEQTRAAHDIIAMRLAHRLGVLEIGAASVAVVVSAAHRAAAFDACRAAIERLKADVPIFKREIWEDGAATWVDGVQT